MKNKLKVYFGLSALLTTLSLTSCKKIDESSTHDFQTTSTVSSENLDTDNYTKTIADTQTFLDSTETKFSESEITTTIEETEPIVNKESITISFTGDCTLGTYLTSKNKAFDILFDKQKDYDYYFQNVKEIFERDDYTVVNLEGPLTDATSPKDKEFVFKGREDYVNILVSGNVEAVNLENNHINDYHDEGYNDTINVLEQNNINYFNTNNFRIAEIKSKKVGFVGIRYEVDSPNIIGMESTIDQAFEYFNENDVDLKIVTIHGGREYDYDFDMAKQEVSYYAIDNGADLIVGHHPHILQGVEEYNNKYILYSLGNFCYGGHSNPSDKNSMIAQVTFNFDDNKYIDSNLKLIPVSISSVDYTNNFQPTILEGEAKENVLKLINNHSYNFNYVD